MKEIFWTFFGVLSIILLILLCAAVIVYINCQRKKPALYRQQEPEYWYRMAFRDELTGLYNRAAYNRKLRELESAKAAEVWLVLLDIDDFKRINDSKGHLFGDQVLASAAHTLTAVFSVPGCTLCRIGGDEFAVIAELCAEELQRLLEKLALAEGETRFSRGYARVENGAFLQAFACADEMLYAEKAAKKVLK